jgi:hypothetical protein
MDETKPLTAEELNEIISHQCRGSAALTWTNELVLRIIATLDRITQSSKATFDNAFGWQDRATKAEAELEQVKRERDISTACLRRISRDLVTTAGWKMTIPSKQPAEPADAVREAIARIIGTKVRPRFINAPGQLPMVGLGMAGVDEAADAILAAVAQIEGHYPREQGWKSVERRARYLLRRIESGDDLGIGEVDTLLREIVAISGPPS